MESQREELIHQHTMEKDDLLATLEHTKEELGADIVAIQRDRDDSLLLAENEKQQVSSL